MASNPGQILNLAAKAQILAYEIPFAYAHAAFPMSSDKESTIYNWYRPDMRGLLPIEGFHVSRSLNKAARRIFRSDGLSFSVDLAFSQVIQACAARSESWIGPVIMGAFEILHNQGMAHSLEIWYGSRLAGGFYGLGQGRVFFAESMFSHETDGSKLALWAGRLYLGLCGYTIFDTQYINPHLASLGGYEMAAHDFQKILDQALAQNTQPLGAGYHPDIITRMIEGRERR